MKGTVFNGFEAFVDAQADGIGFDRVLDEAKLDDSGLYIGPGTYPDRELVALLTTYGSLSGRPIPELLSDFGRFLFGVLDRYAPRFARGFTDPIAFIETLDSVLHVELRKLHPEAYLPEIGVERHGPNRATVRYVSKRHLCMLAHGLLRGCADHFDHTIEIEHVQCVHHGHECCVFDVAFARRASSPEAA